MERARRSPLEQIVLFLHRANTKRTWKDFTGSVQAAEIALGGFRARGARLLLNQEPSAAAERALWLARHFSAWSDELVDPEQPAERRAAIEAAVTQLHLATVRAAENRLPEKTDEVFVRTRLIELVDAAARWSRSGPQEGLPKEVPVRWFVLAGEVARQFADIDAERAELLRRKPKPLADAIEASCNTGGRARTARIYKATAIPALCEAVRLPAPDLDSIKKGARARPRAGKKKRVGPRRS